MKMRISVPEGAFYNLNQMQDIMKDIMKQVGEESGCPACISDASCEFSEEVAGLDENPGSVPLKKTYRPSDST